MDIDELKSMLDWIDEIRANLHLMCQEDNDIMLSRAYQKLTEGADILYKLAYHKENDDG